MHNTIPQPVTRSFSSLSAQIICHKRTLASLLLIAICPFLGACAKLRPGKTIGASVQYWNSTLSGEVEGAGGLLPVDLDRVLDVDEQNSSISMEGSLYAGNLQTRFRLQQVEHSGDTTLNQAITVFGQSFNISSLVESEIQYTQAAADLRAVIVGVRPEEGPYALLGGITGLRYMSVESSAKSISPLVFKAEEDLEGVFPVLGLFAEAGFRFASDYELYVAAEVDGASVDYGDVKGDYVEGQLELGLRLLDTLALGLGFRLNDVSIEDDDASVDMSLEGIYFTAGIDF